MASVKKSKFVLSWKQIIPLVLAGLFMISIFAVFIGGERSSSQANIVVDMGQGNVYRGRIAITENSTALNVLSNFAYSVKISEGKINCIANFCNTNTSHWVFYSVEETALGPVEKEVEQSIESYILTHGETIVFRYKFI